MAVIGTCGNCGGPVEVPDAWLGIYPPTPICRRCGATPRDAYGPRIPMNPGPQQGEWHKYVPSTTPMNQGPPRPLGEYTCCQHPSECRCG